MRLLAACATDAAKLLLGGMPVVVIDSREELAVWLRKQPRDVVRTLADRWALRWLPITSMYQSDLLSDLMLPCFRVVAASWASVTFPAYEMDQAFAAARAAGARAFAAAARAAQAPDTLLGVDDEIVRTSFAFLARAFAASATDDSEGRAFAAASGARAFHACGGEAAAAAFWSAISADACSRDKAVPAAEIASNPLWPDDLPIEFATMWQDLKAQLHTMGQNWQVWTMWYDDRLEGRVRDEKRELAYVRIENALWDRGAAIVNAEIAKHIESGTSTAASGPAVRESSIETARANVVPARTAASPRPVFKGFFSYSHSDAAVDPDIVAAFSAQLEKRVDAKLVNAAFIPITFAPAITGTRASKRNSALSIF
jgi:hypothetical protein